MLVTQGSTHGHRAVDASGDLFDLARPCLVGQDTFEDYHTTSDGDLHQIRRKPPAIRPARTTLYHHIAARREKRARVAVVHSLLVAIRALWRARSSWLSWGRWRCRPEFS